MKKLLFATLLAGLALAQAARAVSIDFDSPVPVTYNFNKAQIVQGTGSNSSGGYAAPYGDTTKYLSVQLGGSATFTFAAPQKSLALLWGSVDLYNTIEFFNNGSLVATFTGGDVMPGANGNQGPDGTVNVPLISGTTFNSFTLIDGSLDAFEVDNITTSPTSVPDGGTTVALLGLAMVAVVVVRAKLRTA